MRTLLFAAAAVLSLATAGTALAERAPVTFQELAAAGGNHPAADTTRHGTQLAASGMAQPHDNERSANT